jgi:suppressor of fused
VNANGSLPPSWAATVAEHVDQSDGGPPVGTYHPRFKHLRRRAPIESVTLHRVVTLQSEVGHWHLVTRGLSEPGRASSPAPAEESGRFELTFRVAGDEIERPLWAVDFLASLAGYVTSSGHPFEVGDHIDLGGPVRMRTATAITAALVVEDPVLGSLDGPSGPVDFLQVVGLTAEELELCRSWSTDGVMGYLVADDPLLVTDLDRRSILDDPGRAAAIDQRVSEEGAEVHELQVASLRWGRRLNRRWVVQMGAGAASALGPALRRELARPGARFTVVSDQGELRFVVAAEPGWSVGPASLDISVPDARVDALAALFDGRTGWARLAELPGLWFRVVP